MERIDAKGVFHLESSQLAVRPVGVDEEFAAPAKEAGMDAVVIEARIVEIAEHGFLGGVIHGVFVLGFAPKFRFGLMATGANFAADECRRGRGFCLATN